MLTLMIKMHKDDLSSDHNYELISRSYYDRLMKEKIELINVILPDIRKKIQVAREMGDLSENAEYQSELAKKIRYDQKLESIKHILNTAIVFDITHVDKNKVYIGSTVTIQNMNDNSILTLKIVSSFEINPKESKISYKTSISQSLIGKELNSIIEFNNSKYKIIDVKYD